MALGLATVFVQSPVATGEQLRHLDKLHSLQEHFAAQERRRVSEEEEKWCEDVAKLCEATLPEAHIDVADATRYR